MSESRREVLVNASDLRKTETGMAVIDIEAEAIAEILRRFGVPPEVAARAVDYLIAATRGLPKQ
jgi:hypothetical protein